MDEAPGHEGREIEPDHRHEQEEDHRRARRAEREHLPQEPRERREQAGQQEGELHVFMLDAVALLTGTAAEAGERIVKPSLEYRECHTI